MCDVCEIHERELDRHEKCMIFALSCSFLLSAVLREIYKPKLGMGSMIYYTPLTVLQTPSGLLSSPRLFD